MDKLLKMMSQPLVTTYQSVDDPAIRVEYCRGADGNKSMIAASRVISLIASQSDKDTVVCSTLRTTSASSVVLSEVTTLGLSVSLKSLIVAGQYTVLLVPDEDYSPS